MMTKILALLFAVYLFSGSIFAQKTYPDEKRTYLKGGESFLGIQFRKEGTVFYEDRLLMGCSDMGDSGTVEVSTPTPKRGLSLVKCTYEDSAYIIDTINKAVLSKDIIAKNEALGHFISWSPDEKYLVAVRGGEGICVTFVIYDLKTFRSRELRVKDCGGKSDTNDFEERNFIWINNTSFRVQMDIHCNPYDDDSTNDCQRDKILRSYNAQLNIVTLAVTYGNPGTPPGTQTKAGTNKNSGRPASVIVKGKVPSVAAWEFSAANVWKPEESEESFGPWEKIHEKCPGGGGFGAWSSTSKKLGIKQRNAETKFTNCISAGMKKAGASPAAIAFTKYTGGEVYMYEFTEMGKVDLAVITAPLINDPNVSDSVLVNGTPRIFHPYENIGKIDISRDPLFPTIQRKYPDVEIWPMHGFEKMEALPSGGQRFIFDFLLLNGCRACEIAGSAFVAFDFNETGKFIGTKLIRLEEYVEQADSGSEFMPGSGNIVLVSVPGH
jgi:hypothetical protein